MLQKMYTDFYISKNQFIILNVLKKFINLKIINKVLMRYSKDLKYKYIKAFPSILFLSFIKKILIKNQNIYSLFVDEAKSFNNKISKDIISLNETTHFYSFRNDSLEIFKFLKINYPNIKKILEVSVAPAKFEKSIIMNIRNKKFKKWENNINNNKSFDEIIKRENQEMKLSDRIIVPSKFVKSKIILNYSINPNKIKVIPYSIPKKVSNTFKSKNNIKRSKLKVLTVGDICLRKGVHHVYEVAKELKDKFEFIWIGKSNLNSLGMKEVSKYIKFVGEVPNNQLDRYFNSSDIYFLPSLCEGSAISLYEAYLSNLYLIYSKNCGFEVSNYKNQSVVDLNSKKMIIKFKKIHLNKNRINFKINKKNQFSNSIYEKKFINFIKNVK